MDANTEVRELRDRMMASLWGRLPKGTGISGEAIRNEFDREIVNLPSEKLSLRPLLMKMRAGFHDEDCLAYQPDRPNLSEQCNCPAKII